MRCRAGKCGCGTGTNQGRCGLDLRTGLPVVIRLVLGGLFILAGVSKLSAPMDFAFAMNGFHLGISDGLIRVLTFVVPWAELLAGALLMLGLWARGAGMLIAVMMAGFAAGIASVMFRGLDVKCGCFGALKLFCGDLPMGWCHLVRNGAMAAAALTVVFLGPGCWALDSMLTRTSRQPD